jgi:restriction system protein
MLKRVRNRRSDALSQMTWQALETLLAVHYRGQGYAVEHVGTAVSGSRYDGGIDLKLRRGDEYVIVECKHWNARQVPHNVVHQLLGIMVNEGATGAIVVSSGEFTERAKEAAARRGEVQLVDGDALRALLGPLPAPEPAPASGWRNVDPAEMRSWRGARGVSLGRTLAVAGIGLATVLALVFVLRVAIGLRQAEILRREARAAQTIAAPVIAPRPRVAAPARPLAAPVPLPSAPTPPKIQLGMTEAEKAEWNRKNAESMKIIEKTTPEM